MNVADYAEVLRHPDLRMSEDSWYTSRTKGKQGHILFRLIMVLVLSFRYAEQGFTSRSCSLNYITVWAD